MFFVVGQSERQQIKDEQRQGGLDEVMCLFGPEFEEKWKVQRWLIGVFRSEVMRVATGTHRSALSGRWMYSHHRDAAQSNRN